MSGYAIKKDGSSFRAVNDKSEITSDEKFSKDVPELKPVKIDDAERREAMIVTRAQARIALHNAGLLDDVEAYVNAEGTSPIVRIAYQDASEWKRTSATTIAIQNALSLSDKAVDDLFDDAAKVSY